MRRIAAALLVAFAAAPAAADDKNEDKAKAAAVAFLKAVKAKDVDAVMKISAAPFATRDADGFAVLKDEAALKSWIKDRLDDLKDADKVPTEIDEIHAFAEIKAKVKDEAERKKLEDVVGKDGFVVMITADEKKVPILVRVKDGKAAVVGLVTR